MTCCIFLLLKNATASDHATWGISPIPLRKKTQQSNLSGVTKVGSVPETGSKCNCGNYLHIHVKNGFSQALRWFSCNRPYGRVYRTSAIL